MEALSNGIVLGRVLIDSPDGVAMIRLKSKLKELEEFQLRSGSSASAPTVIQSKKPVIFRGAPYRVAPASTIVLLGGNLKYQDLSVEMAVDGGPFASVPFTFANPTKTKIAIQTPPPTNPPAPLVKLSIRILRTTTPEDTMNVKTVLVVPSS